MKLRNDKAIQKEAAPVGLAGRAMAMGGSALKGVGKSLPVIGNVVSGLSGAYNLATGNFADAGLDFAGMLPGIGNYINLGRTAYDVGKAVGGAQPQQQRPRPPMPPGYTPMMPNPQGQIPFQNYSKMARDERYNAFKAGIDRFCKEAGFDDDDKQALIELMLVKSAIPIAGQEIEDSMGSPGGTEQPGSGGFFENLGAAVTRPTEPTLARQLNQSGLSDWSPGEIAKRTFIPGYGLLQGAQFLAQRYITDPYQRGVTQQNKIEEAKRMHQQELQAFKMDPAMAEKTQKAKYEQASESGEAGLAAMHVRARAQQFMDGGFSPERAYSRAAAEQGYRGNDMLMGRNKFVKQYAKPPGGAPGAPAGGGAPPQMPPPAVPGGGGAPTPGGGAPPKMPPPPVPGGGAPQMGGMSGGKAMAGGGAPPPMPAPATPKVASLQNLRPRK